MTIKPFLKWAGGKRWLLEREAFQLPDFKGCYLEPFLAGGAVFFKLRPSAAILSDINRRLIETYIAIRDDWRKVWRELQVHQERHSKDHYYQQRDMQYSGLHERAAQFLYLNRACWNGLYRENLQGKFNVPIGTKQNVILDTDDFQQVAQLLSNAEIICADFEAVMSRAGEGDLVFADPPYTTAHNLNGFVKYNQKIFSWSDQIRLRNSAISAQRRGARVIVANANHSSVNELYREHAEYIPVSRPSVISGKSIGRSLTTEALFILR